MTRGTRPVPAIDMAAEDARLVGLVDVSDDDPGIRRRRAGKGFSYVDAEGNRIADRLVIQPPGRPRPDSHVPTHSHLPPHVITR